MPVPTFLVGGAARAGTTALIEGLRLHPDVFVTAPKEPHYLAYHGRTLDFTGPGDEEWVNRTAITDRSRYLALFDGAGSRSARGDGSVTTLYCAETAVPEILKLNPEMRVVLLLREPVDRAFSSFTYLRLRGMEPESDFRSALADEARRKRAGWHHLWHYSSMSHYSQDLGVLLDGLGSNRVRVWFYDDLQSDYGRVLAEVVEFLCLPPFASGPPELPRVNASGTARVELAQRAIRWATKHQVVRAGIKNLVSFEHRERIRSSVLKRSELPLEVTTEVAEVFRDDLAALPGLLPGPLPTWLSPADSPG